MDVFKLHQWLWYTNTDRPWLLDLFCGAGGAAVGYWRAGFNVVGVDIAPQPNYPFYFVQGDALEFAAEYGSMFDAIHASPPCQNYSAASVVAKVTQGKEYPDLVGPVRDILRGIGKPYAIENVPGAPLQNPLMLCGTMFNLMVIRHRLFECEPAIWFAPHPCRHWTRVVSQGRRPLRGKEFHCITGHFTDKEYAIEAMGVDWMSTRREISESIPPAYTEYIGKQFINVLKYSVL